MKSSTLPPLRMSPELRASAEAVLAPGESLSSSARTRPVDLQAVVSRIETSFELLEYSPFSCRKAWPGDRPLVRELVIPFGSAG
jgi:hypothetical protein